MPGKLDLLEKIINEVKAEQQAEMNALNSENSYIDSIEPNPLHEEAGGVSYHDEM
jgi:hypothetical protein